jgi:hypothetical protein
MSQVREPGPGYGQVLASLPPGLGDAAGGREPSAAAEQVAWDGTRSTLYEYSDASAGTAAYIGLTSVAHASATSGGGSAYNTLRAGADLDDNTATGGPTTDVAPGLQGAEVDLAPGQSTWLATAILWDLDEDAAGDVDLVRAWWDGRAPDVVLQAERDAWSAWHGTPPAGLDAAQQDLWRHSHSRICGDTPPRSCACPRCGSLARATDRCSPACPRASAT